MKSKLFFVSILVIIVSTIKNNNHYNYLKPESVLFDDSSIESSNTLIYLSFKTSKECLNIFKIYAKSNIKKCYFER